MKEDERRLTKAGEIAVASYDPDNDDGITEKDYTFPGEHNHVYRDFDSTLDWITDKIIKHHSDGMDPETWYTDAMIRLYRLLSESRNILSGRLFQEIMSMDRKYFKMNGTKHFPKDNEYEHIPYDKRESMLRKTINDIVERGTVIKEREKIIGSWKDSIRHDIRHGISVDPERFEKLDRLLEYSDYSQRFKEMTSFHEELQNLKDVREIQGDKATTKDILTCPCTECKEMRSKFDSLVKRLKNE